MKQRGIEKDGIALFQRNLHMVRLKIIRMILPMKRKIPRRVKLREGKELCRTAFQRHVAMRNRALQRQRRRDFMGMCRVSGGLIRALEAEVIVPVCLLRLSTRPHLIDLRGHLVVRAKPCLASCRDGQIAEVKRKTFGIAQTLLLQRIPDPVVGSGCSEMIAFACGLRFLIRNNRVEHIRSTVDH